MVYNETMDMCVFLAKLSEMAMDIYIYIQYIIYYIYTYVLCILYNYIYIIIYIYIDVCVCEIVFVGYDIDGMYNQTYDTWVCLS